MDSDKLCPRHTTHFKKSSSRSKILAGKTMTSLSMREETIFKKAFELSTLCDVEVCVIYYGRDGKLIKTWPEDESKVRNMAERFSKLSHGERLKKSTNLSQVLIKKIMDDKKNDGNKFSQRDLEMKDSLQRHIRIVQDELQNRCSRDHQSEPCAISTDLSSSLVVYHQTEPSTHQLNYTEPVHRCIDLYSGFPTDLHSSFPTDLHSGFPTDLYSGCPTDISNHLDYTKPDQSCIDLYTHFPTDLYSGFPTDLSNHLNCTKPDQSCIDLHSRFPTDLSTSSSSSFNHPTNFSVFLLNHDNGAFTQLASTFHQPEIPQNNGYSCSDLLLEAQGFGDLIRCNNISLPHQMQTQNPLPHQMQTQNLIPHQMQTQNPFPHQMQTQNPFPHQIQTQNPLPQFDQYASWN